MDDWTTTTLADHRFTAQGTPSPAATVEPLAAEQGRLPQAVIDQALAEYNAGKPEERRIPLAAAQDFFEDPTTVVNIAIDDVMVKKQKPHRNRDRATSAEPLDEQPAAEDPQAAEAPTDDPISPKSAPTAQDTGAETAAPSAPPQRNAKQRPKAEPARVHNSVAHVAGTQGHYILTGTDPFSVLRILMAWLLNYEMLGAHRIQFFVDGARDLHAAIRQLFGWVPSLRIILDWYHLEKKCKETLSLALRGKTIRNDVLAAILPLLWLAQVDATITYLQQLPAARIKDRSRLEKLINYFERHREEIPCYALRHALGLRNSSNPGEKANDLCVADRQKHRGMSWSPDGSVALTSTTTLGRNHELDRWCETGELSMQWVA